MKLIYIKKLYVLKTRTKNETNDYKEVKNEKKSLVLQVFIAFIAGLILSKC